MFTNLFIYRLILAHTHKTNNSHPYLTLCLASRIWSQTSIHVLTHLFHEHLLSAYCECGIRGPVVKKAEKVTVLKVHFVN